MKVLPFGGRLPPGCSCSPPCSLWRFSSPCWSRRSTGSRPTAFSASRAPAAELFSSRRPQVCDRAHQLFRSPQDRRLVNSPGTVWLRCNAGPTVCAPFGDERSASHHGLRPVIAVRTKRSLCREWP
ncbi:hypothetical protein Franean1_2630 [Parafrankia sp. EAN1pec]|nr:hypothetical protein Franean1_2630 [Frankia sp. EAN1pec]